MAISYSLEIATRMSPAEVAHALREAGRQTGLLDDTFTLPEFLGEGVLTKRGSWVLVMEEEPDPRNPLVTDLGLTSTVSVTFRMNSLTSPIHYQQDDTIALTMGVLNRVPGDAVLNYQFEVIWLLRRDGELTVNEQDDIWPPHRLALVDIPYRRETHTFDEDD